MRGIARHPSAATLGRRRQRVVQVADSINSSRDSHGGELDESHESGTELVVAGGDAPELFELVEEALDIVAFTIECLGPTKALLAPDHVGDVGDGSARLDVNAQAIGVIGLVGDDDGTASKVGQERFSACQVMRLPRRNQELERPALAVNARVDFRGEPAAASSHTAISTLFLTPEACW